MLTIIIPNRNRKLATVCRTLASLDAQCTDGVDSIVVDYGSEPSYQEALTLLVQEFSNIQLQILPTQGQLWQKTRAINCVLKNCENQYFMVVDMDMLFHPSFVSKVLQLASSKQTLFFQVGILSEEESKEDKAFDTYKIKFKTNEGATGMTLFPTEVLRSINGFDEFYHGWGGEDTDVHVRLQNAGHTVTFYDKECLLLHQWHPKFYRSKDSFEPFHSTLEKINQNYLKLSRKLARTKANLHIKWGVQPDSSEYRLLATPTRQINITNREFEVKGLCAQLSQGFSQGIVRILIQQALLEKTLKRAVKKQLGKVVEDLIPLDLVNNIVLETILLNFRNRPYHYAYDRRLKQIEFTINFDASV